MPWSLIAMRPWITVARLAMHCAESWRTVSSSQPSSAFSRATMDGVALTATVFSSCEERMLRSEVSVCTRRSSDRALSLSTSASLGTARWPYAYEKRVDMLKAARK